MVAVAASALVLAIWAAWFDPVRRWQRAVVDDENGARRWEAIQEMWSGEAGVDEQTALVTLVDALHSPSRRIRETAVAGLGRLGPAARPAAPALIGALADPEAEIRRRAAEVLVAVLSEGDAGRDEARPALVRLLGDRSPWVRLRAAWTLVEFGATREALPALLDALRRPDYMARGDALWAIGRIGPSAADEALPEVKRLESEVEAIAAPDLSRLLRVYAAQTRCLLGDRPAALATLRALAADPDAELAAEAARVLAQVAPDEP
jgi:HEAT repeat protein